MNIKIKEVTWEGQDKVNCHSQNLCNRHLGSCSFGSLPEAMTGVKGNVRKWN